MLDEAVLAFFDKHAEALPLYERLEAGVREMIPDVTVRV